MSSPWPPERLLGHVTGVLRPFFGYFGRSPGQRGAGVAKVAGREPPADTGVAIVTYVAKPAVPARASPNIRDNPSVTRDTPIAGPAVAADRARHLARLLLITRKHFGRHQPTGIVTS